MDAIAVEDRENGHHYRLAGPRPKEWNLNAPMKCMFLNIWLGKLPPYFPFFLKSTLLNAGMFQWYLFTDQISEPVRLSESLFLIPFSWEDVVKIVKAEGVQPRFGALHLASYRMLLPYSQCVDELMRSEKFTHFGTFDLDVIYGDIRAHLPGDAARYLMISGHPGLNKDDVSPRGCGPFTIHRRDAVEILRRFPRFQQELNSISCSNPFDENRAYFDWITAENHPVYYRGTNIQPVREAFYPSEEFRARWTRGRLTVSDGDRLIEGAFFHFMKFKRLASFHVNEADAESDYFTVSKDGISLLP